MNVSFTSPVIKPFSTQPKQIVFQGCALKAQPTKDCIEFGAQQDPPPANIKQKKSNKRKSIAKKQAQNFPITSQILNELISTVDTSQWKKARKGSTKISETRVYDHPKLGKIKLTLTLEHTPASNISYLEPYNITAILEVPQYGITYPSSLGNSSLAHLAKAVFEPETIERLQQRATRENELTIKRFNRQLDEFGLREKKHKNRNETIEHFPDEN